VWLRGCFKPYFFSEVFFVTFSIPNWQIVDAASTFGIKRPALKVEKAV
jgi:hypothetical protein